MQILDVAHDIFIKPRGLKISTVICLGLGSLSGAVGRCCCTPTTPEAEVKANTEAMVFLEEWVKQLRQRFEIPDGEIYFQDPTFNFLDHEFITSRGYTVISSPTSSSILNSETFLFAPFLEDVPLYMSLKKSFPAVYIGSSLTDEDPWSLTSNPDFKKFVRPFVRACENAPEIDMSANSEDENAREKLVAVYYPLSDTAKAKQSKTLVARIPSILKRALR